MFIGCCFQTIVGIFNTVDARQMALVQVVNILNIFKVRICIISAFISLGKTILGVPAKQVRCVELSRELNNDFIGTVSSSTYGLMWANLGNNCTVWTSLFLRFFYTRFRIMLREDPETSGNTKKEVGAQRGPYLVEHLNTQMAEATHKRCGSCYKEGSFSSNPLIDI